MYSRHVRVFSSRDEFLVRYKEVVPKYGMGHCTPKTMNVAGFYLLLLALFYISLHAECELTCSDDFRDKQGVLKLNCGSTGSPMYHLLGNVISATVGLVYINLQPEYELPSSTRFGQCRKFGKIGVGAPSSPAIPRKKFLHGVQVLVRGYICASDLTFLALLTSEI